MFRVYVVGTAVLTLVLIALGGAVRAAKAGLACGAEWPRCFGMWVPPRDLFMWLEHGHRLLAGVVWFLVIGIVVWAWRSYRDRRGVLWPSLIAVAAVTVQAALGAIVVLRLLQAELVTAHLGMAMIVMACLVYIAVSVTHPPVARGERDARDLRFARVGAAVAGLAYLQILVGGHVTGIGAGLAYRDFPLMDGQVIPRLATEAQAFHAAHRFLAYLLAAAVVALCVLAVRHRRARQDAGGWTDVHRWLVKLPMWAATLVVVQVGLGVANVVAGTPAQIVTAHLAVASWIWTVLFLHAVLAHRLAPTRVELAAPPGGTGQQQPPEGGDRSRKVVV